MVFFSCTDGRRVIQYPPSSTSLRRGTKSGYPTVKSSLRSWHLIQPMKNRNRISEEKIKNKTIQHNAAHWGLDRVFTVVTRTMIVL